MITWDELTTCRLSADQSMHNTLPWWPLRTRRVFIVKFVKDSSRWATTATTWERQRNKEKVSNSSSNWRQCTHWQHSSAQLGSNGKHTYVLSTSCCQGYRYNICNFCIGTNPRVRVSLRQINTRSTTQWWSGCSTTPHAQSWIGLQKISTGSHQKLHFRQFFSG